MYQAWRVRHVIHRLWYLLPFAGTEMRRLQTRVEELESDIEWMEVKEEGLSLEVETLRDAVRALSGRLRRLQREISAVRRTGRNGEDRERGTSGRSYRY